MPFSYHNANPPIPPRMVDGVGFGKVAIVTGCASGIGLATTQLFLSHEYQVFGVDVKEIDYRMIQERDQERFHFHAADLMKVGECDEIVRICVAKYGPKIDVLANVAGVMDEFEAADSFTDADWDGVIAVNLTAPTRMIRAVLPFMKARMNGSIINVAGIAGVSGAAAGVAYTASKHGLLGVTKNTAWRFHEDGIRCNAILPGAIDTDVGATIERSLSNHKSSSRIAPIHALHIVPGKKPTTRATDVANAILFLASDQASMINGVSLPIDQAWSTI